MAVKSSSQALFDRFPNDALTDYFDRLPEDLFWEVLMRVYNIKVIHRCKLLSKAWNSSIQHPFFSAYSSLRGHNRGGFLYSVVHGESKCNKPLTKSIGPIHVDFFYSGVTDQERPEPIIIRSSVTLRHDYGRGLWKFKRTQVVDGLICFYEDTIGMFLCNVCTGETMRLPKNKLSIVDSSECFLGYDPISKAYKVLHIHIPYSSVKPVYRLECEVLTLGRDDSSWGQLDTAGAPIIKFLDWYIFKGEPVLHNGTMYWLMHEQEPTHKFICFDFNKEKFRFLRHERITEYQLQDDSLKIRKFVQIGGRPALHCDTRREDCLVYIRLDDEEGDCWSKHMIPLSPDSYSTTPVGNLPSGQTLFVKISDRYPVAADGFRVVWSYDHQTHKFEMLFVGCMPQMLGAGFYNLLSRSFHGSCVGNNFRPLKFQLCGI